ncbi:MAG: hypothetical protein AMXMBFR64_33160 [Myxococcales bacterium]
MMRRVSWVWTVAALAAAPGCNGEGGSRPKAAEVAYDPALSGLAGTSVQQALDELAAGQGSAGVSGRVDALEHAVGGLDEQVKAHGETLDGLPERLETLEHAPAPTAADVATTGPSGAGTVQGALDESGAALAALAAQVEALKGALQEAEAKRAAAEARQADTEAKVAEVAEQLAAAVQGGTAREAALASLAKDLDAKWAAPRPCPPGMKEASAGTCMEPALRAEDDIFDAVRDCAGAGRRLCTGQELLHACLIAKEDGLDFYVSLQPEWSGSVADTLPKFGSPDGQHEVLFAAIGGAWCEYVSSAGVYKTSPGTTTTKFPYRCCTTR